MNAQDSIYEIRSFYCTMFDTAVQRNDCQFCRFYRKNSWHIHFLKLAPEKHVTEQNIVLIYMACKTGLTVISMNIVYIHNPGQTVKALQLVIDGQSQYSKIY